MSLDSIQLFGASDAVVFLDSVYWDPQAQFVAASIGDYNADGSVDAADYTVWRDTMGATGPGLAADGDGNNVVDGGDYTWWKNRYAAGATPGIGVSAAGATVPEASSMALLLLAAATSIHIRNSSP